MFMSIGTWLVKKRLFWKIHGKSQIPWDANKATDSSCLVIYFDTCVLDCPRKGTQNAVYAWLSPRLPARDKKGVVSRYCLTAPVRLHRILRRQNGVNSKMYLLTKQRAPAIPSHYLHFNRFIRLNYQKTFRKECYQQYVIIVICMVNFSPIL